MQSGNIRPAYINTFLFNIIEDINPISDRKRIHHTTAWQLKVTCVAGY